jgi:hypothetical protein
MASVPDVRWRAFDALGNAYSGATLAVVDAGTATPSSIYTDAALSIPAANPVVADANGVFPQFYAPEGKLFDLTQKTAGGVTLKSYLSVAAIGNQTDALLRDFTTSRFQAQGAGGVTELETGNATGNDVGGIGRIGGWAGTQGDSLSIDYAAVNVTGRLKEQTYKLDGVVRQEAVTFTNAAAAIIPLTNDPTGVRQFEVTVADLVSATNTTNQAYSVTFSYDGGVTYAAAGYSQVFNGGTGGAGSQIAISLAGGTNAPNVAGLIRMTIQTPNAGNNMTAAVGVVTMQSSAGFWPASTTFAVFGPASSGRCTHVKLVCSAGNISCICRVRPLRGFGET